ncbi:MAG TPA: hypothetical protein VN959_22245 [Mycobacterium sp.]|nr:hypothetical protein [Mycobacterium sp.]
MAAGATNPGRDPEAHAVQARRAVRLGHLAARLKMAPPLFFDTKGEALEAAPLDLPSHARDRRTAQPFKAVGGVHVRQAEVGPWRMTPHAATTTAPVLPTPTTPRTPRSSHYRPPPRPPLAAPTQ